MYICVYVYMAHCSTACFLARSFATYRRGGVHHFCRCMGSFAFATLAHSNGYGVENVAGKPDLELVELRVPLFVPAGELLLELCKLRRELSRGVLELGALPPTRVRWLDEPGRLDARLHDPVGKEPEKPVERQKGSIGLKAQPVVAERRQRVDDCDDNPRATSRRQWREGITFGHGLVVDCGKICAVFQTLDVVAFAENGKRLRWRVHECLVLTIIHDRVVIA
mmetsp:Transcript_13687/g.57195  ORF Transcript_13687/g.57195 Transcript_13687/m.57195 type:complete len:223 (-) Transcript_13687:2069-2737(-)